MKNGRRHRLNNIDSRYKSSIPYPWERSDPTGNGELDDYFFFFFFLSFFFLSAFTLHLLFLHFSFLSFFLSFFLDMVQLPGLKIGDHHEQFVFDNTWTLKRTDSLTMVWWHCNKKWDSCSQFLVISYDQSKQNLDACQPEYVQRLYFI